MDIQIALAAFGPHEELRRFDISSGDAGAIVSFIGKVRGELGTVRRLHLHHHPDLSLRSLERIAAVAAGHWSAW